MEIDIGSRLRAVREARSLSQRELAARSGLTNGTISLIEQNKTSPSVASLKRVLDAIPMTMSEFFAEVENTGPPKYFYGTSEFIELSPGDMGLGDGAARLSLRQVGTTLFGRAMMILSETYEIGADTGRTMIGHEAEEGGIVIAGRIEVTVGDRRKVLGPGDAYYFDSRQPHRFRQVGPEPCRIVSACTPPTF